jgi:hypothetical protein
VVAGKTGRRTNAASTCSWPVPVASPVANVGVLHLSFGAPNFLVSPTTKAPFPLSENFINVSPSFVDLIDTYRSDNRRGLGIFYYLAFPLERVAAVMTSIALLT